MNWNNLFQLEKVIWNRNKFEVIFLNTRMIWFNIMYLYIPIQNTQYQKLSNDLLLKILKK